MSHWYEEYLGIPFCPGGRDFDGCDCGGLVLLVLWHRFGIKALDMGTEFSRKCLATKDGKSHMASMIAECAKDWHRLPEGAAVKPFDCVIYRWGGAACHCGLVVDDEHILHVETHHAAHLDRIKIRGYEIEAVYRHDGISPCHPGAPANC